MTEASSDASFEKIVEWAYRTLPEKIRDLPDFPGIQVLDEPPESVLRKWVPGKETLGLYSGIRRTQQRHDDVRIALNLIFVFRGPILRCSKGNLPAEVKQVVWHEVAHWLGHDEVEVKELGLSLSFKDIVRDPLESEAAITISQVSLPDTVEKEEEANEHPRCIKCYSADVTRRELKQPITSYGAWLSDPLPLRSNIWKCNSCGYEWDDDDNA